MPIHWTKYLDAVHRKIAIAQFHCDQLQHALICYPPLYEGHPDVPTQAFFEGTVVATVSAIDQIAQAVNSALDLRLSPNNLFDGTIAEIERRVPEYAAWHMLPIGRDLRRLRTRMVHYCYDKTFNGELAWMVEVANPAYTESRELLDYAQAAVTYARQLGSIANSLQQSLEHEFDSN